MTEAEENPIYGGISLSLRCLHGGRVCVCVCVCVRSIRDAALVLCVWKSGALQQTELRH